MKKHLGIVFKEIIKSKGIKIGSMGEQVGINTKTFYNKLETGTFTFIETLRLMEFFNIDLEDLKERIGYEPLQIKEWKNA